MYGSKFSHNIPKDSSWRALSSRVYRFVFAFELPEISQRWALTDSQPSWSCRELILRLSCWCMARNFHIIYQKIRLDELYLAEFTDLYLHSNCQRYLKGKLWPIPSLRGVVENLSCDYLVDLWLERFSHNRREKIRLDELYLAEFTDLYLHSNCQRYLKGKLWPIPSLRGVVENLSCDYLVDCMARNFHIIYKKICLDELYLAEFTDLYLHSNCQRYLKGELWPIPSLRGVVENLSCDYLVDVWLEIFT